MSGEYSLRMRPETELEMSKLDVCFKAQCLSCMRMSDGPVPCQMSESENKVSALASSSRLLRLKVSKCQ